MAETGEDLSMFCISAHRRPRIGKVSSRYFTHENRKKYRRICFNDTKTVFLVPRKRVHYVKNLRATDFYKMIFLRAPDYPFYGTVFVMSYDRMAAGIMLKNINDHGLQQVSNYMTVCDCLDVE